MSICGYCNGEGHCWLPINRYDLLISWESTGDPRLTMIIFEDCECPVCEGTGELLFLMDSMSFPSWISARRLRRSA